MVKKIHVDYSQNFREACLQKVIFDRERVKILKKYKIRNKDRISKIQIN